jgi:hypothetical protein
MGRLRRYGARMARLDPTKTWQKVEERLGRETDPRKRLLLENVLAHMRAESAGDIDGLMATLAPDPRYHQWGATPADHGPKGRAAVEQFYRDFVASGATNLEYDVERLVVDDDCIVTEGMMRIVYPGATLQAMGREVDEPDAYYLYEARMAVFWPYDADGMLLAEDAYTATDGFANLRVLERDELPVTIAAT